jgi:hypothetical protein
VLRRVQRPPAAPQTHKHAALRGEWRSRAAACALRVAFGRENKAGALGAHVAVHAATNNAGAARAARRGARRGAASQ